MKLSTNTFHRTAVITRFAATTDKSQVYPYPIPPQNTTIVKAGIGLILAFLGVSALQKNHDWAKIVGFMGAMGSGTTLTSCYYDWKKQRKRAAEILLEEFEQDGSGAPDLMPFQRNERDTKLDQALIKRGHGRHAALVELHETLAKILQSSPLEVQSKVARKSHKLLVLSRAHNYEKVFPSEKDTVRALPKEVTQPEEALQVQASDRVVMMEHKQYQELFHQVQKIQKTSKTLDRDAQDAILQILARVVEHSRQYHQSRGRFA